MAGRDGGKDFRMRQESARGVARRVVAIEHEGVAFFHHHRAADEAAEPQLRALQVDENADRPAAVFFRAADRLDQLAHLVVAGVAHVDAEDVDAGGEQPRDHLGARRGRPQRGDNLGAAQASHFFGPVVGGCTRGWRLGPGTRGVSGLSGACSAVSVSCTVHERCSPVSTSK